MITPISLDFPLAKAEYLLTRVAEPGKGGDKRNYWQNILGFRSAEEIRKAILDEITVEKLKPQGIHPYGDLAEIRFAVRLVAIIQINTPLGRSQPILTIWLVPFETSTARFITAIPNH